MPAPFLIARSITSRVTLSLRAFSDRGEEPRIAVGIGAAELRGDHDFFHELADDLAFFQTGDFTFCVEPLASHALFYPGAKPVASSASHEVMRR